MDRNHESFTGGMLQNEVRTGLASFAIALTEKKANELAGGNHSIQRECDRLRVNHAGRRNGLAFLSAVLDVKAHGLQDAFLGLLDGFSQTIDTREIVAVSVIAPALAFYGYRIAVEGHRAVKFTMKQQVWRAARWREGTS